VRRTPLVSLAVAAVAVAAVCASADSSRSSRSRIEARIAIGGAPFRVATGGGSVWVVRRSFVTGCRPSCALVRVDPGTNRVVSRIRLPGDAWSVVVGGGAAVTTFDGRLTRVDIRTGRLTRVSAPQTLTYGAGAVWVADHGGALVKIDPATAKVVARTRLDFGPPGVIVTRGRVYVADAHASRPLEADPATAKILRIRQLPVGAILPAAGAGSIWSGSSRIWGGRPQENDDRVLRIDPRSLKLVATIHVGGNVPGVAFGFGSVWAAAGNGQLVRIDPRR
jgi:streptogramin lyase